MTAQALADPKGSHALAAIKAQFASPEEIDESPQTAPSRRLRSVFPGYRKPLHGPLAIHKIGLDRIRQECPHFNQWLTALENLSA